MTENAASCNSSSSSTEPLTPKSPPKSLDLHGKRRQIVKFQALEREIGLLQEEIKLIETLQPASRSCKELDDFVIAKQDPFLATNQKIQKSQFLKRIWRRCCFSLPCICCFRNSQASPNHCCCFKKTTCCICSVLSFPGCRACCSSKPGFCKCSKVNHRSICVKPCCG